MISLKKEHFPHLNELRFLCASLVILHHIEQVRSNAGIYNFHHVDLFRNGGLAVNVFFVLSGFLITYLLLVDILQENKVNIKKFYINRTLRIWPLYFIMIFVGFLLLPFLLNQEKFASKFPYLSLDGLLLYVFFLPNLANGFWSKHFLIPLWSIGVEEQFYLIFAPLISWFRNHVLTLLLSVFAVRFCLEVFLLHHIQSEAFQYFLHSMSFESMAIGGFFAWIHVRKHRLRDILMATSVQIMAVAFLLFSILYHTNFTFQNFEFNQATHFCSQAVFSLACGIFIYNVATNPNVIIKIKNKYLDELGKISYGIYMYHMLYVFAAVVLIEKINFLTGNLVSTLFVYFFVFTFTILTSFLSYYFIEKKILAFK